MSTDERIKIIQDSNTNVYIFAMDEIYHTEKATQPTLESKPE